MTKFSEVTYFGVLFLEFLHLLIGQQESYVNVLVNWSIVLHGYLAIGNFVYQYLLQ